MQTVIGLGYYLLLGPCFALIGAIGHVIRAKFNLVPDLLFRRNSLNLMFSDGYNLHDALFGTEYDDAGYYRLDSMKNFKISVGWFVGTGWCLMLLSTDFAVLLAHTVDATAGWLGELAMRRLSEATWW
jgi:hypothetical protein